MKNGQILFENDNVSVTLFDDVLEKLEDGQELDDIYKDENGEDWVTFIQCKKCDNAQEQGADESRNSKRGFWYLPDYDTNAGEYEYLCNVCHPKIPLLS